MNTRSLPAAAVGPPPLPKADVLAAVSTALRHDGPDWAVLEAWVFALTVVTWAALRAVPEELHDFL
ncbi:hypothetical protein [Blastococcus aggregatus]|uniref:hypothetical protein n=1 Tax=Blastococcus aggregatus TaxID=38502 RepID=UPI0011436D25|nr:hypothetical protein [Blastococcus aggregatus]